MAIKKVIGKRSNVTLKTTKRPAAKAAPVVDEAAEEAKKAEELRAKLKAERDAKLARASKFKTFVVKFTPGLDTPLLNAGFIIYPDPSMGIDKAYAVLNRRSYGSLFRLEAMEIVRDAIAKQNAGQLPEDVVVCAIDKFTPLDSITGGTLNSEFLSIYLHALYQKYFIGIPTDTKLDLCAFASCTEVFFSNQAAGLELPTTIIMQPRDFAPHAMRESKTLFFLYDLEPDMGGRIVVVPQGMNRPFAVDRKTFSFFTDEMSAKSARTADLARILGASQTLANENESLKRPAKEPTPRKPIKTAKKK